MNINRFDVVNKSLQSFDSLSNSQLDIKNASNNKSFSNSFQSIIPNQGGALKSAMKY
jgi:hypothetical protein